PDLQAFEPLWVLLHVGHRNLVRAPIALEPMATDLDRSSPALGGAQHDHRPARSTRKLTCPCLFLELSYVADRLLHGGSHCLVHAVRIRAFNEIRCPAITTKQIFEFFVADSGEQGRIVDLIPVEVQDGKYRAVANWVQKFV